MVAVHNPEDEGDRSTLDRTPADAIVDRYDEVAVDAHRLFVELRMRPVDLSSIWWLMANLQVGISGHFTRWLAQTIARIDDMRIASLLAKQLNDELGGGDFGAIHSVLFQNFIDGLARYRSRADSEASLQPGRQLFASMDRLFAERDPYVGVGALIVSEIFASKFDRCVGDEIRRHGGMAGRAELRWLALHETLELDHAGDSSLLAQLVPRQGPSLAATWRGAHAEWSALWGFLDEIAGRQA